MDNLNLEIAKEVVRVYHKTKDYRQAYKEVTEMYKKSSIPSDQTRERTHKNNQWHYTTRIRYRQQQTLLRF